MASGGCRDQGNKFRAATEESGCLTGGGGLGVQGAELALKVVDREEESGR